MTVMRFKNLSVYIQRQIDHLLWSFQIFICIYVNDIIIYFKILKKHLHHLSVIFSLFVKRNIFIKLNKVFLKYLIVQLLRQKISLLRLTTDKEKLKIIVCLMFLCTLKKLETYLELMRWLCQFVLHYTVIIKSL